MRKLNFALLAAWTALAFAAANKGTISRVHGEWLKLAVRVAQQPLPFDLGHTLLALDPDGHWLHAIATMTA